MSEQQGKKISFVEGFLMISFVLLVDILDIVLVLAFGAGLILNSVVNVFATLVIQFWLSIKGIRGLHALTGNLIEFIPAINVLPARTIMVIVTIYIANKPVVAKVASATKGKIAKRPTITSTIPNPTQRRIKPTTE